MTAAISKLLNIATIVFLVTLSISISAAPKLNGIAIYTELGTEQFIAAVYSETQTSSARQLLLSNEDKVMEIRVLADRIRSRRFKRMWVEGIAINAGPIDLERHAQDLADFTNIIRVKLKQGDILRIERNTGKGTEMSINGFHLGSINNTRFFDLLLRTWVGPVPLSSDFKKTMLSRGEVSKRKLKRFQSTTPSPNRLASLSSALKAEEALKNEALLKQKLALAEAEALEAAAKAPPEPPKEKQPPPPKPVIVNLPDEDELFENEDILDSQNNTFTADSLLSQQLYISKLTKWTGGFIKYPRFSVRHSQEGTVRLSVVLARDGKVTQVTFIDKSRYSQLNKAAKKAIKSASPYPRVPDEITGEEFKFTIPVVFMLN